MTKKQKASHVFFIMQQAYGENAMYDYHIVENKFKEVMKSQK